MHFRVAPFLLALSIAAAPAAAQSMRVEGRWRVLVRSYDPGVETMRGELRLADSAGRLRGTLRLESDSGAPLPLSRASRPAPDSLEIERVVQGPLSFAGRWTGIAWAGEVTRAGRPLGRWEAVALDEDEEFYPAPPTFILRQMFLGSPAVGTTVPGAWLGAARARLGADPVATLAGRHAEAARRAGASGVERGRLDADGERWLLGLVGRHDWRNALVQDLATIRARLEGRPLARFDALFEPSAGWITDLHDAALRAARRRRPAATWGDWAPGLLASGLAEPGADDPAVMESAWRLWALAETDTAAFRLRLQALRAADSTGGGLPALLRAYGQAAAWHQAATAFLAGLLDSAGGGPTPLLAPLGGPGAAAAGALDSALAAELVRPGNWEGERWLARHGPAGLFRALSRLEPEYGEAASVDLGQGRVTLTTPAAETRVGHLGIASVVRYDPGEAPLLAAARVAVERERTRLLSAWRSGRGLAQGGAIILLPDPEPHLAVGVAELAADRTAGGLPLVQAANGLRRALAAARDTAAPVTLGYELVASLAEALGLDSLSTARAEVLGMGYDLAAVAERPGPARAWARWRGQPAAVLPGGRGPVVIPELRFLVEGGEPQVAGIRIHAFQ